MKRNSKISDFFRPKIAKHSEEDMDKGNFKRSDKSLSKIANLDKTSLAAADDLTLPQNQPGTSGPSTLSKIVNLDSTTLPVADDFAAPQHEPRPSGSSTSHLSNICLKETDTALEVPNEHDIGHHILKSKEFSNTTVPDAVRTIILSLTNPDNDFQFPAKNVGGKMLKFQRNWINKWKWLIYSKHFDGAFCKYCVAFSKDCVGKGKHQKIGVLVDNPFVKWKHAVEKFRDHEKTAYHKESTTLAENFLVQQADSTLSVISQLDSNRRKQILENRDAIRPIIKTVIFCGQNEIALRGDDESSDLSKTLDARDSRDGKFRALLRFRVEAGDNTLKEHLENAKKNAMYTSPKIVNEIIDICGKLIQTKIVKDANESGFFSILADETLDVSGIEQFSLCVRYVDLKNMVLKDDFLCFIPLTEMTGVAISNLIIKKCGELGLNLEKLAGQGYDGAGSFSGEFKGVQARIRELYPKAMYVHCANHRLNLALSAGMTTPCVKNCLQTIKDICNLFRNNSLNGHILKSHIQALLPETKRTRLIGVCETRFVERHNAIIVFVELIEPIVISLFDVSATGRDIAAKAEQLVSAMKSPAFLISVLVCEKLLSYTLALSQYLQSPEHDLSSALTFAKDVIQQIQNLRSNTLDEEFKKIFTRVVNLSCTLFGIESITMPRITGRQVHRENYPADSPLEYFKRSIFIPCLDDLLGSLKSRFEGSNVQILTTLEMLLPHKICVNNAQNLSNLLSYLDDDVSAVTLESEYHLWAEKWKNADQTSIKREAIEVLAKCDAVFYPHIHTLLKLLVSLPVSTASVERSFSTLKRVKTYLRNKMGNDRLTGLVLMSAHSTQILSVDDVLHQMSLRPRRLNLTL